MHISDMDPTVPFENYAVQSLGDFQAQARAELAGRQSNYMTNMVLPEIVKSSKNYPLGSDCVITRDATPDETVLVNVDLYWLISQEKGCVECRVLVSESPTGRKAITHDPRVIITRKPRRFEAYCCAVCRQNFVTVVQALLHMKAFHRQNKRILIQDQNVFHDIDKAMEVPPVPLPWYVAKRVNEQSLQIGSTTAGVLPASDSDQTITTVATINSGAPTSNEAETNPVTVLLQSIVKEYGKQVHTVLFGKGLSEVQIQFEDKTSVVAHLPDLEKPEPDGKTEISSTDKLEFQVQRLNKAENDTDESCVVKANNPVLAHKLIAMALKQGVAQGSETDLAEQDSPNKEGEKVANQDNATEERTTDSPSQLVKLNKHGRPSKTVRFMLGSPDSDEDGSSSASEKVGGRESSSPIISVPEKEPSVPSLPEVTKVPPPPPPPPTGEKKSKVDEGLKGVVNQLISTASKGIISPVEPVSPVPVIASSSSSGIREEILATASLHARYMPKNRSVPNLSSMTMPISASATPASPTFHPPVTTGMVRVQSWGGADPSQRFSLSTYTPSTPQNFDHMSRDELRKSFLTVGRSFTYAEKIKLMNKLNDEDALITQEHVKGAGKLIEAEASRQERGRVIIPTIASPMPVIQQTFEKPHSPTVVSTSSKVKPVDSQTEALKARSAKYNTVDDPKKRRKSKYDVEKFILVDESGKNVTAGKRPFIRSRNSVRSSSEGSLSDRDGDDESADMDENDDGPPTLLDVLRTNRTRTGFMPHTSDPSTSQHIPTTYPSMLSNSEYYGSGEWASAAMQTLRNLQTKVNTSPPEERRVVKTEVAEQNRSPTEEDSDSRSSSPFVNTNSGMASKSHTLPGPFVTTTAMTKTDTSAVDTIMALAQHISTDQPQMKHLPKPEELAKVRSQRKRSLSPLLTEGEKDIIRARAGSSSSERSHKKAKKDKGWQWHGAKSELNSNNRKKANTSAKRRSESTSKFVIAEKGDSLEFIQPLTGLSLEESDEVTLKFCKSSSAGSDSGVDAASDIPMDMPQLFTNSIETLVKVRYVEKIGRCRVCGFSVVLDDSNNGATMKSHVMEHSLKELLQAGCNGKQLI